MKVTGVSIQANEGFRMNAGLQDTATVINIFPAGYEWYYGNIHIYIPVGDYERARRAVAAFNVIMDNAGPPLIDLDEMLGLNAAVTL